MFLSVILPGNGMRLHTKVFGAPACVQPVVFSDVVLLCSGWVMSVCERQWFSQMPHRLSDEQRKLISYANRFFVLAVGLFHSLWADLFFGWYGILLIKTWKLICSNSYRRFVVGEMWQMSKLFQRVQWLESVLQCHLTFVPANLGSWWRPEEKERWCLQNDLGVPRPDCDLLREMQARRPGGGVHEPQGETENRSVRERCKVQL